MRRRWSRLFLTACLAHASACSLVVDTSTYDHPRGDADVDSGPGDDAGPGGLIRHEGESCDDSLPCEGTLVCEPAVAGGSICGVPFVVAGRVVDVASGTGIANATVLLIDAEDVAVSDLVTTSADGRFEFRVSIAREVGGLPSDAWRPRLRIDAASYASHPNLIEDALVVVPSTAIRAGDSTSYETPESSLTVRLTRHELAGTFRTISGRVTGTADLSGQLVVAHIASTMLPTAISDRDGDFVLFNVPSGAPDVRAYRAGSSSSPVSVDASSADQTGVVVPTTTATGSLSGSVAFVGTTSTAVSVRLAVADSFVTDLLRGAYVPGVSTTTTGAYSLTSVPFGSFVVVASDENDGRIADPDATGGSNYPSVSIATASNVALGGSIKVKSALVLTAPAGPATTLLNAAPTFRWADLPNEQGYVARIYGVLGTKIAESNPLPAGSGAEQSFVYNFGGLTSGVPYRLVVVAVNSSAIGFNLNEQRLGWFTVGP